MKLSKLELKQIVKECLLEILSEGIGSVTPSSGKMPAIRQTNTTSLYSEKVRSNSVQRKPTPQLHDAVKREAGGNKIMEMILADTAASTLPKMLEGDRTGSAPTNNGVVEQVVAAAAPEDIFGEDVASKWANLAFMDSSPKK